MTDYETTQRRRNIIVGIFVLAALCALTWLIFKFGDLPTGISKIRSFQVFVQFPTAQGVQKDTPVRFCGYHIGRVTNVMAPEIRKDLKTYLKYHQTVVVLSIDKKYVNIPYNVDVKLMTRGLGSSYIEIKTSPPDPDRPPEKFLTEGSWLQGSAGMTSEFFPVESQEKLDELADGLATLIKNTNDIIGDEANKENLKVTLANMSELSQRAKRAMEDFQKFFAAAVVTSEELSEVTARLRLTLDKINSGEGTAARLINDGRLYENLLENTQEMQVLLQQIRLLIERHEALPIKLK